ncbi:MAG TPA: methyltransferase dimerization domain-containing protein, partial [Thermoanaerobaculia bacterium]|nr:methyltransferase dimerization domain-containing protein [Thermoanaerobaculia bacterium]
MATETGREGGHAGASAEETLTRLLPGMWAMQGVATGARLGVFDALANGPESAESVAAKVHADPLATARL